MLAQSASAQLWNVDFGGDVREPKPNKVGFAATGITASDFWNFYSADNPDGSYKVNGSLSNLKTAGGATTGVGLTVNNGDGLWSYATSDPMLHSYIYSLSLDSSVQTSVSVMNLPAGTYNFYLYGGDSQFDLNVGGTDYGTKVSYDYPIIDPPPWVEGHQYVRFSNVTIGASQTALISLGPGQGYPKGIIGGMQIELVPEPSCAMLLFCWGIFVAYRARKKM
jgi:hypothetical protein